MPTPDWTDLIATDPQGESLGRIEDVYVDEASGVPEFALLRQSKLGGLRHRNVLVPVHAARESGGELRLPYDASQVREAPDFGDRETRLTPDLERGALTHFEETRRIAERDGEAATVVLHEERMEIGRRVVDHERLRVRKVIITEEVTLRVQLRREELEVLSEPIGEGIVPGGASDQHLDDVVDDLPPDMVLYGEEPVVTTRIVPREQVRFSRRVVTDRVTIEEPVRHEDASLDVTGPRRGARAARARPPPRRRPAGLGADGLVDLVEQAGPVVEVEVLGEVPVGLVARLPVQGHVQGDEPRALDVPVVVVAVRGGGAGRGRLHARAGRARGGDRPGHGGLGGRLGHGDGLGLGDRGSSGGGGRRGRSGSRRAAGRRGGSGRGPRRGGAGRAAGGAVELGHVRLEQREVGVEPVRAGAQRLHERAHLALHRVDALEHERRLLAHPADVLAGALDRLGVDALGVRVRLGADALGVGLGVALDRGGALLGGLDDGPHLLGGRGGQGGAAATLGGARERVDLVGQLREVLVDGLGLVAPPADGEVLLLDRLTVQGHGRSP
jgi:hypothetical protein